MAEQGEWATSAAFVLKYRVPMSRQRQFFEVSKKLCSQLATASTEVRVEEVRLLQPMFGDDETVWVLQIRFRSSQDLGRWMDATSGELSSDGETVPSPRSFAQMLKGVELLGDAISPLYRLYSIDTPRLDDPTEGQPRG